MSEQISFIPDKKDQKSCYGCDHFSELLEPRERSDGVIIFGYCFKRGDKDHNPNMGKGFAVFIADGHCREWRRRA